MLFFIPKQVPSDSENTQRILKSLLKVLGSVLSEMRNKAHQELQS